MTTQQAPTPPVVGALCPEREERTRQPPDPSAREELSKSEQKLRGIVALAVDAIISTDGGYRVTLFNTAAERIFGYSAGEVLGQPLDMLLPEGSRGAHHVHLAHFADSGATNNEMGERGQIWGRRKTGELFPAEASISKMRLGAETHFTAVLRDITQTRRLEHEREMLLLRERQARAGAELAVKARDDVLAVVSHDLRNPLSVISMCATSLLAHGAGGDAQSREAINTIRQSAQWAQRLIQDLLDVTSIEAGGLSLRLQLEDPLLLVARAAHVFEELATARSIILRTELPEALPLVYADADRMLQAMGNLIGNAVKFAPAGGTIVIGTACSERRVQLFVTDSGPGVPAEDVPHVFDRYWTARRDARTRGTGMGLAIVRGIMDAHDGEAWVEANPSGGARFVLALPIAHRSIVHPAAPGRHKV